MCDRTVPGHSPTPGVPRRTVCPQGRLTGGSGDSFRLFPMFAVSGPMFAVSGPMLLEAKCADSVQTVELVEYAAPNCEYMETDESCLERTLEISRDLWPYVMLLRVQQTIVCHSKCCCASCKLLLPIRTAAAHVANFCSTLTFPPQLAATFSDNIWPFELFSAAEPF